jgi:hypothetical protein
MSIPCKFERSILSYDEHEIILRSHHPEIYDAGLDDLKALRQRLRDMRDKERTLARENRRAVRGKGESRGGSFPGTAVHPLERKQVFAAALKRVSKEIGRMQKLDARTEHIAAARRALAMRRAAQFPSRPPDRRRGRRRHASVTERAAANQSASCQDRHGVTGDQECASRSRRAHQGMNSVQLGRRWSRERATWRESWTRQ